MSQLACTMPEYLARRDDPVTSHVAAAKVPAFKPSHEGLIWGALDTAGDRGVTQNEIAGLAPVQANRRFASMMRRGLIYRRFADDDEFPPKLEQRDGCAVWRKA